MAIGQGGFVQASSSPTGTGSYSYAAGTTQSMFYAGTFFIDTGYDDPVLWTVGVDCAEVYAARVYANHGTVSPAQAPDTYLGKWNIVATPVWSTKFWGLPTTNTPIQKRVLIRCDVYLSEPVSNNAGDYQVLDTVDWSLYRV